MMPVGAFCCLVLYTNRVTKRRCVFLVACILVVSITCWTFRSRRTEVNRAIALVQTRIGSGVDAVRQEWQDTDERLQAAQVHHILVSCASPLWFSVVGKGPKHSKVHKEGASSRCQQVSVHLFPIASHCIWQVA